MNIDKVDKRVGWGNKRYIKHISRVRSGYVAFILLVLLGISGGACRPEPEPPEQIKKSIFDGLSPQYVWLTAGQEALALDRKVMMVFTAEGCKACRTFELELQKGPLGGLIHNNILVVKIDVEQLDKYTKDAKYIKSIGDPIKKGIPSIAIFEPMKKQPFFATYKGELSAMGESTNEDLYEWFYKILQEQETKTGVLSRRKFPKK